MRRKLRSVSIGAACIATAVACVFLTHADAQTARPSAAQAAQAPAAAQGSTASNRAAAFRISPNGAATYTLPIRVAPGTRGMQPSLSLAYNSQGSNGVLGVGWNLSGLSQITRCGATYFSDGFSSGVNYNANDRFCLDGARLMNVAGYQTNPYYQDGSVYHTQIESWRKVVANAKNDNGTTCGSGPCWFAVTLKDGTQLEYGRATGSQFLALDANGQNLFGTGGPKQGSVRAWALDKITDRNGNSVSFTYTSSPTGSSGGVVSGADNVGAYYIARIDYTANAAANPATVAQRLVQFFYTTRPDVTTQYQGGARITSGARLASVVSCLSAASITGSSCTSSSVSRVASYNLTYCDQDSTCTAAFTSRTGRSVLYSLIECGSDGTTCLPPNVFTWQTGPNQVQNINGSTSSLGTVNAVCNAPSIMTWADFNGDGLPDWICNDSQGSGTVKVLLNTPSNGTVSLQPTADAQADGTLILGTGVSALCSGGAPQWTGFTASGNVDWVCNDKNGYFYVLQSNGETLVPASGANPAGGPYPGRLVGTDGLTPVQAACPDPTRVQWADFNGDGYIDWICTTGGDLNAQVYVLLSNGATLQTIQGTTPTSLAGITPIIIGPSCPNKPVYAFIDINGDGMADFTCSDPQTGSVSAYYSTGTTLVSANSSNGGQIAFSGGCAGTTVQWADINGDGLPDWACINVNASIVGLMVNTGAKLVNPNPAASSPNNALQVALGCGADQAARPTFADFNGDGLADLICYAPSLSSIYYQLSSGTGLQQPQSPLSAIALCSGATTWTDFNGDRLIDWVCTSGGQVQVLIGSPSYPDLAVSLTNSLGGQVTVSYAPLTDSTVYGQTREPIYPNGEVLGFPQLYVLDRVPLYVAAGYTLQNDASRNQSGTAYSYANKLYYTNGVIGLLGLGWQGFGSVTVYDATVGNNLSIDFLQGFPFTGRAARTVACTATSAGQRCENAGNDQSILYTLRQGYFCETQNETCRQDPRYVPLGTNAHVAQVLTVHKTAEHASFGYRLEQLYDYDSYGNAIFSANLGDVAGKGGKPVYTCASYSNSQSPWLIGFVVNQKQASTSGCPAADAWSSYQFNATSDLSWQQTAYDGKQNVLSVLRWDSRNDDWLGRMVGRDTAGIGNIISVATTNTPGASPTAVANTTWSVGYDSTFKTFVASVTSPPATPGNVATALGGTFAYDARFGTRVGTQGPNGAATGAVKLTCVDVFGAANISQGPLGVAGSSGTDSNCLGAQSAFYGATGVAATFTGAAVTTLSTTAWSAGSTSAGPAVYSTTTTRTDWANAFASAKTRWTQTYIDGLGRPYRRINQGVSQNAAMDIKYLTRKRIGQVSLPYVAGSTPATWITAGYDNYGRKKRVTLPYDGRDPNVQPAADPCSDDPIATTTTICWEYAAHNTTTRTDAANTDAPNVVETQFAFFNGGRKTTTLTNQGGTAVTTYGFDPLARPISVVDPLGATLTATRDSLGRPWTVTDTENGTLTTSYDNLGRLFSLTDAAGINSQFAYDGIGRRQTVSITGTLGQLADTITYSYDAPPPAAASGVTYANLKGRLSGVAVANSRRSAAASAYAYGYDAYGRKNASTLSFGGKTTTFTGSTTPLGTPAQIVYPDAAGTTVNYGYANVGWPASIAATTTANPAGATLVTYSNYTLTGQPQTVTYGSGVSEKYSFTPLGQVVDHSVWGKGAQVPNLMADSYVWTPLGQVAQTVDCTSSANAQNNLCSGFPAGTATGAGNATATYGYSFERLTSAANASYGTFGYQYHGNGNLVQTTVGGATTSYQYKSVGTAETYRLTSGSNGLVARYDRRGNMIYKQTPSGDKWVYVYDEAGRLIEARKNKLLAESYVYDYKGRRLQKLTYAADGKTVAATTNYVGPLLVQATGSSGSEDTVNLMGAGGLIGARSSTSTTSKGYYFHRDALNQSTRLVTDGVNGNLLSSIFYQPYGATAQVTPANSGAYRSKFQGHELDGATGLYYLGARYYDPAIGRFVSADKQLGAGPYRQDAFNRYAMVLNDPVLLRDPNGRQAVTCAAIGAVVGFAVGAGTGGRYAKQAYKAQKAALATASANGEDTSLMPTAADAAYHAFFTELGTWVTIGGGLAVGCYAASKSVRAVYGKLRGGNREGAEDDGNASDNDDATDSDTESDAGDMIELDDFGDLPLQRDPRGNISLGSCSTPSVRNSFTSGTSVAIENGSKPIADIRVGDRVWALDPATGKNALYPVTRLHGRKAPGVLHVTVGGQIVDVTAEHPFKVVGRGWVKAMHLHAGDRLVTLDGVDRVVGKIEPAPGPTQVFNFTVGGAHSYYVSAAEVLSHNAEATCATGETNADSPAGEGDTVGDTAGDTAGDVAADTAVDDAASGVVEAGADVAVGAEVGVDTAAAAGGGASFADVLVGFLGLLAL